jgi:hypothetical protein
MIDNYENASTEGHQTRTDQSNQHVEVGKMTTNYSNKGYRAIGVNPA